MKKILLGMGTITAIAAPVATLVSCSGKDEASTDKTQITNKASIKEKSQEFTVPTYVEGGDSYGASIATRREQRLRNHLNLFSAHIYMEKNQAIEVVNNGTETIEIVLFLYGKHRDISGGGEHITKVKPGETKTIKAEKGAEIVYIRNGDVKEGSNKTPAKVKIFDGGLKKLASYEIGKTTDAQFKESLKKSTAQVAQITSKYFSLIWERKDILKTYEETKNPNMVKEALARLDEVATGYAKLRGLKLDGTGVNKWHGNKMMLETTTGPNEGNYGVANMGYISFTTGAGHEMLTDTDFSNNHGLLHEIAHMWQTNAVTTRALWEATNNAFLYSWQRSHSNNEHNTIVDKKDYVKTSKALLKKLASHPTTLADDNGKDDGKGHKKVEDWKISGANYEIMMTQLELAFGKNFYPAVYQYFRTHTKSIELDDTTVGRDRKDKFIVAASKVTGKNLAPFFNRWGIKFTTATRTEIEKLPALTHDIWKNLLDPSGTIKNPIIEQNIKYDPIELNLSKIPPTKVMKGDSINGDLTKTVNALKPQIEKAITDAGKTLSDYTIQFVRSETKYSRPSSVRYITFNVWKTSERYSTENTFFIKRKN